MKCFNNLKRYKLKIELLQYKLKSVAIFCLKLVIIHFFFLFQVRQLSEISMQMFEKMTQQVGKTTTITGL